MDAMYEGQTKIDGELYSVQDHVKDRRPFKAYLDVGLTRTTTGNRVFGALKGACDGGLYIPHNEKRFPGYHIKKAEVVVGKKGKAVEQEKAKASYSPKEHRAHIFGEHVQAYYEKLSKGNADAFKKQFSRWTEALKKSGAKSISELYTKAHEAIRKAPASAAKKSKAYKPKVAQEKPTLIMVSKTGKKWLRQKKIGIKMRKDRVKAKIQSLMAWSPSNPKD